MNRAITLLATSGLILAACGGSSTDATGTSSQESAQEEAPVAALTPDEKYNVTVKPSGPVKVDYRIVGTPIVGQPVTIELNAVSNVGDVPVTLSFQTHDTTAMSFPKSQVRTVQLSFANGKNAVGQQVTVVPNREGRLFLNVTAEMPTDTGSLQTVTAIPIQVGSAPRDLTPSVPTTEDEEGNQLREMPVDD